MFRLHISRAVAVVLGAIVVLGAFGVALERHEASAADDSSVASLARIVVKGVPRSYELVRPRTRSRTTLPVLVVLHGRNMTARDMAAMTGFDQIAPAAVLVYPSGYRASWNAGTCCGPAQAAAVDDVAFLRAAVAHVLATQPDTSAGRVFLVGYSNGGRMVYRMACSAPGLFAGFAAVEAVSVMACPTPRPVHLLEVASTGDPLLTVRHGAPPKRINGMAQPTVEDLMATWRAAGRCGRTPHAAHFGPMQVSTWPGCSVQLALLPGGSHRWPSQASGLIWQFVGGAPATP